LADDAGVGLCSKHAAPHFSFRPNANFLQRLTADCDEFTTGVGVQNSLSELYKLLAAAVLAYTANLFRTIPTVHSELDPDSDKQPVKIDIDFGDLPRPNREGPKRIATEERKELSTSAASNGQDWKE